MDEVSRSAAHFVRQLRPPVVGAMHITCCDQAEYEVAESFQRWFINEMLPSYKYATKSAFRSATLGAHYQWGAVRIAESHFTHADRGHPFKVFVVKINTHVSMIDDHGQVRFGYMSRFNSTEDSTFCGALHALLDDADLPFLPPIEEMFASEGKDRLAALRDPERVAPGLRGLFAAVTAARLEARRVMLDIQDHHPGSPTLYLILPCVSINRKSRDTEILCGYYEADYLTPDTCRENYSGLGDDPAAYRLNREKGRLHIEDDSTGPVRAARDHRSLVLETWEAHEKQAQPVMEAVENERYHAAAKELRRTHGAANSVTAEALKALLWIAADLFPIPVAVLLFAKGLVGMHHVYKAHRLARMEGTDEDARALLADVAENLERLPQEKKQHVMEVLTQHAGKIRVDGVDKMDKMDSSCS